jgi:hypothetical protein
VEYGARNRRIAVPTWTPSGNRQSRVHVAVRLRARTGMEAGPGTASSSSSPMWANRAYCVDSDSIPSSGRVSSKP